MNRYEYRQIDKLMSKRADKKDSMEEGEIVDYVTNPPEGGEKRENARIVEFEGGFNVTLDMIERDETKEGVDVLYLDKK